MSFDFDFDFDFDNNDEKPQKAVSKRAGSRHEFRKFSSERTVENLMPFHLEENECWHCFSFGDVDSWSYARAIIKQNPIDKMILSTWCMANADVEEIELFLQQGKLKEVDFYVGEIFKKSYESVYEHLLYLQKIYRCRVCVFRNHAKVYVLTGKNESFVIESSANVNTNPRAENTVVTKSKELAIHYTDLFKEIKNYEKGSDDLWKGKNNENCGN